VSAPAGPIRILVVGEEHVREKLARHYDQLQDARGIETHYYVDDRSGITRELQRRRQRPLNVHYAPVPAARPLPVLRYWREFVRTFERVRPDVLEVYSSVHFALLYPMMEYARARGVARVMVCRGELWPPVFYGVSRVQQTLLVRMIRSASLVVYKELYMDRMLNRYAPRAPRFCWTNAIPVGAEPGYAREGDHVLFLNFFKEWRNLDVVVRAASRVRERHPGVRFWLVGGSGELAESGRFYADLYQYEQRIRALIAELGVDDCVRILPYTAEVAPHYARAKVYVLPSDLVFCNYALLEAMERGVPPVVSDEKDPDARRIVEDGVSGVVAPIDPAALADAISTLLADEPLRQRLARGARARVEERYDLQRWIGALGDRYAQLAAARRARRAGPAGAHALAAAGPDAGGAPRP
jgi:glycosyltransferase involved in cell wall biosynthesis